MPEGPGKYDELATIVREMAMAQATIVIIFGGILGSGFSVQGPIEITPKIPKVLREIADEIEKSFEPKGNA